jgi:hypothetical protein
MSFMKRVSDAQQMLKNAFAEHECKSEDASQTTAASTSFQGFSFLGIS